MTIRNRTTGFYFSIYLVGFLRFVCLNFKKGMTIRNRTTGFLLFDLSR